MSCYDMPIKHLWTLENKTETFKLKVKVALIIQDKPLCIPVDIRKWRVISVKVDISWPLKLCVCDMSEQVSLTIICERVDVYKLGRPRPRSVVLLCHTSLLIVYRAPLQFTKHPSFDAKTGRGPLFGLLNLPGSKYKINMYEMVRKIPFMFWISHSNFYNEMKLYVQTQQCNWIELVNCSLSLSWCRFLPLECAMICGSH